MEGIIHFLRASELVGTYEFWDILGLGHRGFSKKYKKLEIDCQRMAIVRVKMTINHRISWGFGVPGVYCFRQTHVKFN